jgi:hypothetical protein
VLAAIICKQYGWDWETYNRQPIAFLESVLALQKAEAEEAKRNVKH